MSLRGAKRAKSLKEVKRGRDNGNVRINLINSINLINPINFFNPINLFNLLNLFNLFTTHYSLHPAKGFHLFSKNNYHYS